MKTTLKTTLLITLITRVDLFVNLLNNIIQVFKETNNSNDMETQNIDSTLYWLLQILATAAIFFIVYNIFKKIENLRDELKLQQLISNYRNVENFKEAYKHHNFQRLPNETMDDFLNRSHEGIYEQKMVQEIFTIRMRAKDIFNQKTGDEVDALIERVYDMK